MLFEIKQPFCTGLSFNFPIPSTKLKLSQKLNRRIIEWNGRLHKQVILHVNFCAYCQNDGKSDTDMDHFMFILTVKSSWRMTLLYLRSLSNTL